MRPPTRIELKSEDAQEYIKAREKAKKMVGANGPSQTPLASLISQEASSQMSEVTPVAGSLASRLGESSFDITGAGTGAVSQYEPQVEQLTGMGFARESAQRALMKTAGDLEAAADLLLR